MPHYDYLIDQASKARQLAAGIEDEEVRAHLHAYASDCDRERLVMERHDLLAQQEHEDGEGLAAPL